MTSTATQRVLCSHCGRPWQSAQYKTCDACRQSIQQWSRSRRLPVIAEVERPTSTQPSLLPSMVPTSSTQRTLCSTCARPCLSAGYKTCNDCRRKNARGKWTILDPQNFTRSIPRILSAPVPTSCPTRQIPC